MELDKRELEGVDELVHIGIDQLLAHSQAWRQVAKQAVESVIIIVAIFLGSSVGVNVAPAACVQKMHLPSGTRRASMQLLAVWKVICRQTGWL